MRIGLTEEEGALLARIREARDGRRRVSGGGSGVGLPGAYGIQEALGAGRELVGHKLGLLSRAKQEQMGVDEPIHGRIYGGMMLSSPVSLSEFIQPKMEPELAVVLGRDVPPDASTGAARSAIGDVFLGVDVLDSVWEGYRFDAGEVISDNASGGGFLLGDDPLTDPFSGDLRMLLDGEVVAEGSVGALGDPGERLAWLAGEVGGLRAGQVVFLGSPAAAVEARPGALEVRRPGGSVLTARLER